MDKETLEVEKMKKELQAYQDKISNLTHALLQILYVCSDPLIRSRAKDALEAE